jgi:dienelactone hydrolase
VPIGACIDWLFERDDVDSKRIAVCGSSMGGYYAARAGCHEHRLAAAISHGAIYDVHEMWGRKARISASLCTSNGSWARSRWPRHTKP